MNCNSISTSLSHNKRLEDEVVGSKHMRYMCSIPKKSKSKSKSTFLITYPQEKLHFMDDHGMICLGFIYTFSPY